MKSKIKLTGITNNVNGYRLIFEFTDENIHDIEISQIVQGNKTIASFAKSGGFECFIEHSDKNVKVEIYSDFQKVYQSVIKGNKKLNRSKPEIIGSENKSIQYETREETEPIINDINKERLLFPEEKNSEEGIVDLDMKIDFLELIEESKKYI